EIAELRAQEARPVVRMPAAADAERRGWAPGVLAQDARRSDEVARQILPCANADRAARLVKVKADLLVARQAAQQPHRLGKGLALREVDAEARAHGRRPQPQADAARPHAACGERAAQRTQLLQRI